MQLTASQVTRQERERVASFCTSCCVDNVFTYLQCCLNMAHDPTKHEDGSWNKKSAECPTAQQRLKWDLVPELVFDNVYDNVQCITDQSNCAQIGLFSACVFTVKLGDGCKFKLLVQHCEVGRQEHARLSYRQNHRRVNHWHGPLAEIICHLTELLLMVRSPSTAQLNPD